MKEDIVVYDDCSVTAVDLLQLGGDVMDMICPVPDVGRAATERGCYRSYEVITAVFRSSQMILEYSFSRGGRGLYEKFEIVGNVYVHRIKL